VGVVSVRTPKNLGRGVRHPWYLGRFVTCNWSSSSVNLFNTAITIHKTNLPGAWIFLPKIPRTFSRENPQCQLSIRAHGLFVLFLSPMKRCRTHSVFGCPCVRPWSHCIVITSFLIWYLINRLIRLLSNLSTHRNMLTFCNFLQQNRLCFILRWCKCYCSH